MGLTVHFEVLNQLGTPMMYSSSLATRPESGIQGRIFFRTDSPYGIYRDNGTTWDQIAGSGGGGGIAGTGTATQIAFFSAATTLASSANLFWDNTNGRLGINNNTPGSSLDIHSSVQSVIQANNTTLGNSFVTFQLQGTGKWQTGNVYNAGDNYFRIQDQLNTLERFTIRNTGQIDFLGYTQILNNVTGITGTTPSALPNSAYSNNYTFNSGISTSASVNTLGLLIDNTLNYSGSNTINATSYNTSGLFRNALIFGSAGGSITYTQGATGQIRALTNNQVQYLNNGNNNGTISHYANIQILGDNRSGSGLTTFTNRYGLLINDFNDFAAGNTYTNRWGIYQQGASENNFFAGKVGIGSGYSPSTLQLDIIGTARVSGDMQFGNPKGIEILNNPDVSNGGLQKYYTTANSKFTGANFFNSSNVLSASFAYGDSLVSSVNLRDALILGARTSLGKTIFVGGATATQLMTITAAGRLLIGTASESTFIIDANGTGRISNIELSSNEVSYGSINANKNLFLFKDTTSATRTGIGFMGATTSNNGGLLLHAYGSLPGADILFGFGVDTSTATITNTKMALFNSTGNLSLGSVADVASALIQMSSTTKGFLPPRMTTAQKNAIVSPVSGLIVYDTTLNKLAVYSTAWETISSI